MTKKKEKYYNVSELMEILKLDEEIVLHSLKTGELKEQHWVSESTLNAYLKGKKENEERLARLEARSAEAARIFGEKNAAMVEESSFRGQEKNKQNFKTWELFGN